MLHRKAQLHDNSATPAGTHWAQQQLLERLCVLAKLFAQLLRRLASSLLWLFRQRRAAVQ